jgi:cytochrome c peroxidase
MWWKAALALAAVIAVGAQGTTTEWSPDEIEVLRSLSVQALDPPPPDPTNRVADDQTAAALGQALFSDARFSSNGRVSCASCHQPANGFIDTLPTGVGVATGTRRTMPVAQAVYSPWQFWDGRADSLWAQALGPVENPLEHGFTRTEVARLLASQYRQPYEQLFGSLPDLSDTSRFPIRAAPAGDRKARAAWSGMENEDRQTVNRIYSNFGKAIAAFERTLPVPATRFDKYVAGLTGQGPAAPLTPDELAGLRLFTGKANCSTCHNGPMLSNQGFANTGVPARSDLPFDAGRITGARIAMADPFNCKGAFSDADGQGCDELEFMVVNDPHQVRAYKVPSLRGVGRRPPYMHAGQLMSLEQVIDHYNRAPRAPRGLSELKPLHLSKREHSQLFSFLLTLDDQPRPAKGRNGDRHDR